MGPIYTCQAERSDGPQSESQETEGRGFLKEESETLQMSGRSWFHQR